MDFKKASNTAAGTDDLYQQATADFGNALDLLVRAIPVRGYPRLPKLVVSIVLLLILSNVIVKHVN